uniref:CSON013693 protein n=1 Tax=Culicoides sonorensis TaxID=179676 RepID=A0A336JXX3_CULSO
MTIYCFCFNQIPLSKGLYVFNKLFISNEWIFKELMYLAVVLIASENTIYMHTQKSLVTKYSLTVISFLNSYSSLLRSVGCSRMQRNINILICFLVTQSGIRFDQICEPEISQQ